MTRREDDGSLGLPGVRLAKWMTRPVWDFCGDWFMESRPHWLAIRWILPFFAIATFPVAHFSLRVFGESAGRGESPIQYGWLLCWFAFAGVWLGAVLIVPAERHSGSFFAWSLPTGPVRLLRPRFLLAVPMAALVAAPAAVMAGAKVWALELEREFLPEALPAPVAGLTASMFLLGFPIVLAGILHGMFGRLLVRALIPSVLVSGTVAGALGGAYLVSGLWTHESTTLFLFSPGETWFPACVLVAIPLLALIVAVRHSPLLEQGEGRRGLIVIPVMLFLFAWGLFFLLMAPADLFWMMRG